MSIFEHAGMVLAMHRKNVGETEWHREAVQRYVAGRQRGKVRIRLMADGMILLPVDGEKWVYKPFETLEEAYKAGFNRKKYGTEYPSIMDRIRHAFA